MLAQHRPPVVQLHSWSPDKVSEQIRSSIPGVSLVCGFGVDGLAKAVVKKEQTETTAIRTFVRLIRMARDIGAVATMWNAEARYKTPPNSEQRKVILGLVKGALAAAKAAVPDMHQLHTAYDHPSYHSEYPWEAWLGYDSPAEASFWQVYAGGDPSIVIPHRGALPAREAKAIKSYQAAVRAGWIRPDVTDGTPEQEARDLDWLPYYQLHHVHTPDTVAGALHHGTAALWAAPDRMDERGVAALIGMCALWHEGLWHPGGVAELQRRLKVPADDRWGLDSTRAWLDKA